MHKLEARWPCPVCLGARMEKVALGAGEDVHGEPLLLDHCTRCGGIWFELGEVQRLQGERPEELWAQIPNRDERHPAQCHSCRAVVDRDAEECPNCGASTDLYCPTCDQRMKQARSGSLSLDVCRRCKGVWFDHHELASIWELEREKLLARRRASKLTGAADDGSDALLETLVWAPDLVFYGAHVAGHAVSAAARGLSDAPEAVEGAAGAVGEAAASVFESLVEIVSGIFG